MWIWGAQLQGCRAWVAWLFLYTLCLQLCRLRPTVSLFRHSWCALLRCCLTADCRGRGEVKKKWRFAALQGVFQSYRFRKSLTRAFLPQEQSFNVQRRTAIFSTQPEEPKPLKLWHANISKSFWTGNARVCTEIFVRMNHRLHL